jgi:hypothetical protein
LTASEAKEKASSQNLASLRDQCRDADRSVLGLDAHSPDLAVAHKAADTYQNVTQQTKTPEFSSWLRPDSHHG